MRKLHIPLLILAITMPMVSGNSSWAANKNNTSTDSNGCHQPGSVNCLGYCLVNNNTDKKLEACAANCRAYWCNPNIPNPSTANMPKGMGIVKGKPIQAPPPKGGTPPKKGGNAAPIIKGKPVQASPSGTSTDHPIL